MDSKYAYTRPLFFKKGNRCERVVNFNMKRNIDSLGNI